jgi:hypothetical protein
MKQFLKLLVLVFVINITTMGLLVFGLSSNDFIENQVKLRWDKESKLYIQGYLDGKKEIRDSVQ